MTTRSKKQAKKIYLIAIHFRASKAHKIKFKFLNRRFISLYTSLKDIKMYFIFYEKLMGQRKERKSFSLVRAPGPPRGTVNQELKFSTTHIVLY